MKTNVPFWIILVMFAVGILVGIFAYPRIWPPVHIDGQAQIDSLSAAVHFHQMMEDSAWSEARRFAQQRDSALNNPTFIIKTQYRDAVKKSLDAGGLYDVLDTLGAPAGGWVITR